MRIKFTKMHGLGNDFMVIDAISQKFSLQPAQVKLWADRHFGIGFDQLLLVEAPTRPDVNFKYRIFNADGGEVAQCGNGARCFARFVRDKGLSDEDVISVETNSGLLKLKLIGDRQVEVNMGVPDFEPSHIPLETDTRQPTYRLDLNGQSVDFSALSMGNPHAVLLTEDVDTAPLQSLGPLLECHPFFPQRVNVGFMQVLDRKQFRLRVFERGVGETRACGSGACAAMAAGVQQGLLEHSALAHLSGGDLQLEWQGEGSAVMMTGETASVFEGEIEL